MKDEVEGQAVSRAKSRSLRKMVSKDADALVSSMRSYRRGVGCCRG